MAVIETSATLGDVFLKGITATLADINAQVDKDYSLLTTTTLGVEQSDGTGLFKNKTSDKARETVAGISQIGDLQETAEAEDYKSDSRLATYETQFDWQKYTQGITITEEDRDDQIVDAKLDRARYLLVAGKRTMNQHALNVINFSQTAQASLPNELTFYGDGVPLASVIHPIKGTGGTQSNASANGIPLTEVNLETARIALMGQVGDKAGEALGFGRSNLILLVAPALEKQAVIITKSTKRSNTANNDMNIYRDGMMTVMSSQLLSTAQGGLDTRWALIDSMQSPLIFWTRRPLTMGASYITNSNKNLTIDISARYKVGNTDFRGTWVSAGDTNAYAL